MAGFCLKEPDEALTEVEQTRVEAPAAAPVCEGFYRAGKRG